MQQKYLCSYEHAYFVKAYSTINATVSYCRPTCSDIEGEKACRIWRSWPTAYESRLLQQGTNSMASLPCHSYWIWNRFYRSCCNKTRLVDIQIYVGLIFARMYKTIPSSGGSGQNQLKAEDRTVLKTGRKRVVATCCINPWGRVNA